MPGVRSPSLRRSPGPLSAPRRFRQGQRTAKAQLYNAYVLSLSGLVAYWRMDEVSGNFVDSSGTGNALTPIGAGPVRGVPGLIVGEVKTAAQFVQAGGGAKNAAPSFATAFRTAHTFSCWVNFDATGQCSIIDMEGAGITLDASNHFATFWFKGTQGSLADTVAPSLQTTYFYTVTYGANVFNLYKNGVNVATSGTITAPVDLSTTIEIGAYPAGTRDLDGTIDEIALWNRALTQTEISQLYAIGTAVRSSEWNNQESAVSPRVSTGAKSMQWNKTGGGSATTTPSTLWAPSVQWSPSLYWGYTGGLGASATGVQQIGAAPNSFGPTLTPAGYARGFGPF